MKALQEITNRLNAIDHKLDKSNRFRFQKLSQFCRDKEVDPKTVKKFFPDAIYQKGVYWVDLDVMSEIIRDSK